LLCLLLSDYTKKKKKKKKKKTSPPPPPPPPDYAILNPQLKLKAFPVNLGSWFLVCNLQ
jgi:hypothetical protein